MPRSPRGPGSAGAILALTLVQCIAPSEQPRPLGSPRVDLAALSIARGADGATRAALEREVDRARSAGERSALAEALLALALVDRAGRDLDAAERRLNEARAILGATTAPGLSAWLEALSAGVALDRGRPADAVERAERARRAFDAAGDAAGAVEADTILVAALGLHQARYDEAFARVESCLAAARRSDDPALRLRCIHTRAALSYNLADYDAAVRDFAEVADPSSPLPGKLAATARLNLGLCHVHLGDYASARLAIENALADARVPGRTEYPEAVPRYYRGYLLSRLGDHEAALEDYLAALALFRRDGNRFFESFLLVDIGDNLLRRGEPRRAIDEYTASLDVYRAAGNPRGAMLVEEGIGRAQLDLGDDDEAGRRLRRALALADEVGDAHGWSRIAAVLGDRLLRRTAPAEAETLLARAVEVAGHRGLVEERFRATLGLARTRRDRGRLDAALESYRASLDVLEEIRDQLSSESQHLTFSESRSIAYRETIDLLLARPVRPRAWVESFAVAERARARALFELMQHARIASARRSPPRQRERLQILARLSRAHAALLGSVDGKGTAEREQLRRASDELERFDLDEASSLPPGSSPRPLGIEAVRERLTPDQTLVAFWIGPGRSLVWLLRGTEELRSIDLGPHEAVDRAIERYRATVAREPGVDNPFGAWVDPARELARVLGLDRALAGAGRGTLLVVADEPLHGVPLEPLILDDGGGRRSMLGDRYAVVYLPSASFLALGRPAARVTDEPSLFALGDPEIPPPAAALPGAREEVRRIARWFPAGRAEVRLGARATRDALRDPAAARADIVHLAARTVTPGDSPGDAGIALAPARGDDDDGLLRPHEVASLSMQARLVVLSACGTGLGRPVAGEGLHGLARAFVIAGVPAIVPSQWDVSDRATAELMERFYRRIAAGERPEAALARAMRELRRGSLPLYAHPHYWAPFVYFGLPSPRAGGPAADLPPRL